MSRTVVFAERHLNHFRVPFFEGLRLALQESGIRLRVLVGQGTPEELVKRDVARLPWAEHRPTRYFMQGSICWMPLNLALGRGDLLVVGQENKMLFNLCLGAHIC